MQQTIIEKYTGNELKKLNFSFKNDNVLVKYDGKPMYDIENVKIYIDERGRVVCKIRRNVFVNR